MTKNFNFKKVHSEFTRHQNGSNIWYEWIYRRRRYQINKINNTGKNKYELVFQNQRIIVCKYVRIAEHIARLISRGQASPILIW